MSTTRKTITLTEQQNQWVKSQISNGNYTNDREYFRDLVRRDQRKNNYDALKEERLKVAIQAGVDDIDAGRVVDGEIVINRLRERLANG